MSKESEVQREALLGLSGKPGAFCVRKEGRKTSTLADQRSCRWVGVGGCELKSRPGRSVLLVRPVLSLWSKSELHQGKVPWVQFANSPFAGSQWSAGGRSQQRTLPSSLWTLTFTLHTNTPHAGCLPKYFFPSGWKLIS